MRSKTDLLSCPLLLAMCVSSGLAQQPAKDQAPPKQAAGPRNTSVPQTETIPPPPPAPTPKPVNDPGFMEPAQVKALAHKIWLVEFRINDLMTDVHPAKWKTSNVTRSSFNQMLENLHRALEGLQEWRAQFETRPDSMYYGFQVYAAMDAALPRLDGVARAVSQFENTSFGAEFSQAGNQLFDLQQALQPYVAYLVRNSDQALYAAQTNLAGCQTELGQALRGQTVPPRPLKNTFVEFHARRPRKGQSETTDSRNSSRSGEKKAESKTEKKPEPKSK